MEILGQISIGWKGAWWFTALFGLVNLYFLLRYPRQKTKRLFKLPPFESRLEKVTSIISMILFMRGMMIYTILLSIDLYSVWFYVGSIVYLAGLTFYLSAMVVYTKSPGEKPVISGAYRITRHPMQNFSLIMWLGVGIATTNWIILVLCCLQPVLANWFLKSQERYCIEIYGQQYKDYLQKTSRYFFF